MQKDKQMKRALLLRQQQLKTRTFECPILQMRSRLVFLSRKDRYVVVMVVLVNEV